MNELKVIFSGVVAFVPNLDRKRIRVLFPDTPMGRHRGNGFQRYRISGSLDGKPLRRHHPHIRTGDGVPGLRMIEDEEIVFDFGGAGGGVTQDQLRIVPMNAVVASKYCKIDGTAVQSPLTSPLVLWVPGP